MNRVALIVAIVLSGGIGGNPACDALPTRIELEVTAESLTPPNPEVCRDREVTLVVSPEVDGVLHIHGYDEQVPATTVAAGEVIELEFTASRSGQFPIELHSEGKSAGVELGIFRVHEP